MVDSTEKNELSVSVKQFLGKVWSTVDVLTSMCLFVCIFGWGLFHGMLGPSMLELEERTGTTSGQVTQMMTAITAGGIVGVSLGGWSLDHIDERFFLSVIYAGFGVFTIALPWASTYGALLGLSIAVGLFLGGVDAGMNVTTLMTWGWDASALMQAFHFTFAVGTVVSPWIAKPFLSPHIGKHLLFSSTLHNISTPVENHTSIHLMDDNGLHITNSSAPVMKEETKIMFAWLIVGIYFEIIAIGYMVCYLYYWNTGGKLFKGPQRRAVQHWRSPVTVEEVGRVYTACMWILMFLLFACLVGLETVFSSLLVVFSVKGLNLTKLQGLALATVFRGSFAASRGANILFALVLNPTWMMLIDTILIWSSFLVLAISVQMHTAVVWVCTGVAGVGIASFYGAAMSWAGRYMPISGKAGAVFLCGTWSGCLVMPALIGYLIDNVGLISFVYTCFGDSCALVIVFILTQIVSYKWGPHYPRKIHADTKDNNEELDQPMKTFT